MEAEFNHLNHATLGVQEGKSSIWIAQSVEPKTRNFLDHEFWARIFCHDRRSG